MLLRFKVVIESVIVGRWYANFILFTLFYFIPYYNGVIVTDINVTKVRCY